MRPPGLQELHIRHAYLSSASRPVWVPIGIISSTLWYGAVPRQAEIIAASLAELDRWNQILAIGNGTVIFFRTREQTDLASPNQSRIAF